MAPLSRRTFAAFLGIAALTPVLGGVRLRRDRHCLRLR